MNESLFLTIYNLSGHFPLLDSMIIYITDYALYLVYILIVILAIQRNGIERKALLLIILTFILASIITKFLRVIIIADRPFVTLNIQPLVQEIWPKSFPSLHALYSWVVAFGYWLTGSRYTWLLVIIAGLISFSRIYVGVHYPFDIFGGVILAGLSTLLVKYLLKRSRVF